MNNLLSTEQLEKRLNDIESLSDGLILQLSLLTQEIKYLFSKIKSTENEQELNKYFDLLQKIHLTLSDVIFVKGLGLSEFLHNFTREFERVDDQEMRNRLLQKIKK